VADIGVCDTPAVYFGANQFGFAASVMITASHNPPDYNGFKIYRAGAVPVGRDTGLEKLAAMIEKPVPRAVCAGSVDRLDIAEAYLAHLMKFAPGIKGLRVVADCSHGSAATFLPICSLPDGRFPNHGPDPLQEQSQDFLRRRLLREKADFGVLFDGDGDRAIFLDENGAFVSPDMITALLALHFFSHDPPPDLGSRQVYYDIRSSRSVAEFIETLGGIPQACPTGHARIKHILRDTKGLYAGELAGHYYFRDNYYCDSGFIAFLLVLSVVSREEKPLSRMVGNINPYCFSGEINFPIESSVSVYRHLERLYAGGECTKIDGLRLDFPDWWFIVRESNAEPVLRLVIETSTPNDLRIRTAELTKAIRQIVG